MPAPDEQLATYLNDHLAGSAAGVELAEKILASSEGTPLGQTMARLLEQIEEDRATLADLMERIGAATSALKQAGASAAEKLSRLRFHPRVTKSPGLTLLMQIEVLSLGIEGKRLLWLALKGEAATEGAMPATDLDTLIERAQRQREELEPFRVEMAARAFGSG